MTLNQHQKTYWKILKTFANGTKISLKPPLFVENQLVTDFLVKSNLFNNYFSQQYTTIDNDTSISSNITFETEHKQFTFDFCTRLLNRCIQTKAHGHDEKST